MKKMRPRKNRDQWAAVIEQQSQSGPTFIQSTARKHTSLYRIMPHNLSSCRDTHIKFLRAMAMVCLVFMCSKADISFSITYGLSTLPLVDRQFELTPINLRMNQLVYK